jgi:chemotaxis response regulator CheB
MATDNSKRNVVAIGASAGGVEALKILVSGFADE